MRVRSEGSHRYPLVDSRRHEGCVFASFQFFHFRGKVGQIIRWLPLGIGNPLPRLGNPGSATVTRYLQRKVTQTIGGSKGGARDVRPPWGSKFFHFHAVFGKNVKNNSNFMSWRPPWGKSWIRHCKHLSISRVEKVLCGSGVFCYKLPLETW